MLPDEAWLHVAHECPRRIIHELHQTGEYCHGTSPRFPGKVLCSHYTSPRPPGWQPTPAQEEAWRVSQALQPVAAG